METLYDYILENATKFELETNSFDELLKTNSHLRAHKCSDDLKALFDALQQRDIKFVYADESRFFKIPYTFTTDIQNLLDGKFKGVFEYTLKGRKIRVSKIGVKGEIFETGSGSIGNVSTANQEQATCIIWNAYVDAMNENHMFDLKDTELIKNLISDLTPSFDDEWIKSFSLQVQCLLSFFEKTGVNPLEYKLCRYGDRHRIATAYKHFSTEYAKSQNGRRDSFDPVDVMAYLVSDEDNICKTLNNCDWNTYKDKVFGKGFYGISLKKISNDPKFDTYNTGEGDKCIKVSKKIIHRKDNYLEVECKGDFNFDNTTDEEGNILKTVKSVKLVMRSYGEGRAYIDCTTHDDINMVPTLGKCPVHIWRPLLNCNVNDSLMECLDKFEIFLNGKNLDVLKGLKTIINGAVKSGEACLPFILIH